MFFMSAFGDDADPSESDEAGSTSEDQPTQEAAASGEAAEGSLWGFFGGNSAKSDAANAQKEEAHAPAATAGGWFSWGGGGAEEPAANESKEDSASSDAKDSSEAVTSETAQTRAAEPETLTVDASDGEGAKKKKEKKASGKKKKDKAGKDLEEEAELRARKSREFAKDQEEKDGPSEKEASPESGPSSTESPGQEEGVARENQQEKVQDPTPPPEEAQQAEASSGGGFWSFFGPAQTEEPPPSEEPPKTDAATDEGPSPPENSGGFGWGFFSTPRADDPPLPASEQSESPGEASSDLGHAGAKLPDAKNPSDAPEGPPSAPEERAGFGWEFFSPAAAEVSSDSAGTPASSPRTPPNEPAPASGGWGFFGFGGGEVTEAPKDEEAQEGHGQQGTGEGAPHSQALRAASDDSSHDQDEVPEKKESKQKDKERDSQAADGTDRQEAKPSIGNSGTDGEESKTAQAREEAGGGESKKDAPPATDTDAETKERDTAQEEKPNTLSSSVPKSKPKPPRSAKAKPPPLQLPGALQTSDLPAGQGSPRSGGPHEKEQASPTSSPAAPERTEKDTTASEPPHPANALQNLESPRSKDALPSSSRSTQGVPQGKPGESGDDESSQLEGTAGGSDKREGLKLDGEVQATDSQAEIDGKAAPPALSKTALKKKPPPPKGPSAHPPSETRALSTQPAEPAKASTKEKETAQSDKPTQEKLATKGEDEKAPSTPKDQDKKAEKLDEEPAKEEKVAKAQEETAKEEKRESSDEATGEKKEGSEEAKEEKKETLPGEAEGKAGGATLETVAAKKKAPPRKSLPGPPGGKKGVPGVKPDEGGAGGASGAKAGAPSKGEDEKAPLTPKDEDKKAEKPEEETAKEEKAEKAQEETAKEEKRESSDEATGEKKEGSEEAKEEKKETLPGEAEGKAGGATLETVAAKKKAPPRKSLPGPPGGKKGVPGVKPDEGGAGGASGAKAGAPSKGEDEKAPLTPKDEDKKAEKPEEETAKEEKAEKAQEETAKEEKRESSDEATGEKKEGSEEAKEEKKETLPGEVEGKAGGATLETVAAKKKAPPRKSLPGPPGGKKGVPGVKPDEGGAGGASGAKAGAPSKGEDEKAPLTPKDEDKKAEKPEEETAKEEKAEKAQEETAKEEKRESSDEATGEKKEGSEEAKEEKKETLPGEAEGKAGGATLETVAAKKKAPPRKSLPGPPGGKKGVPGVKPDEGGAGGASGAKAGAPSKGEDEKAPLTPMDEDKKAEKPEEETAKEEKAEKAQEETAKEEKRESSDEATGEKKEGSEEAKEEKKETLPGEAEGKAGGATLETVAAKKKAPPRKSLPGPPGGKKGVPGVKPDEGGAGGASGAKAGAPSKGEDEKAPLTPKDEDKKAEKPEEETAKEEKVEKAQEETAKEEKRESSDEATGEKKEGLEEAKEEKKEGLEEAKEEKKEILPGEPPMKAGVPGTTEAAIPEEAREGEDGKTETPTAGGETEAKAGGPTLALPAPKAKLQPLKALPGQGLPKKGPPPMKAGVPGTTEAAIPEEAREGEDGKTETPTEGGETEAKAGGPKLALPAPKAKLQPLKALPGQGLPKKGPPPMKAGVPGTTEAAIPEEAREGEDGKTETPTEGGETEAKAGGPKLALPAPKAKLQPLKALPGQGLPKKGPPPMKAGVPGTTEAAIPEEAREGEDGKTETPTEGGETEAKAGGPKLALPAPKAKLQPLKALPGQGLPKKGPPPMKAGVPGTTEAAIPEEAREGEDGKTETPTEGGETEAKAGGPKLALPAPKAKLQPLKALPGQGLPKKGPPPMKAGVPGTTEAAIPEEAREGEDGKTETPTEGGETEAKAGGPKLALPAPKAKLQPLKALPGQGLPKKGPPPMKAGVPGTTEAAIPEEAREGEDGKTETPTEGGETEAKPGRPKLAQRPLKVHLEAPKDAPRPVLARKRVFAVKAGGQPGAGVDMPPSQVSNHTEREDDRTETPTEGGETEAKAGGPKLAQRPLKVHLEAPKDAPRPVLARKRVFAVKAGGQPGAGVDMPPSQVSNHTEREDDRTETPTEGGETEAKAGGPKLALPAPKAKLQPLKALPGQGLPKKGPPPMKAGVPGTTEVDTRRLAVVAGAAVARSSAGKESLGLPPSGSDRTVSGSPKGAQLSMAAVRPQATEQEGHVSRALVPLSSARVGAFVRQTKLAVEEQGSPAPAPVACGRLSPLAATSGRLQPTSSRAPQTKGATLVANASVNVIANFREQATLSLQTVQAPQESRPPSPAGSPSRLWSPSSQHISSERPRQVPATPRGRGANLFSDRLFESPQTPAELGTDPSGDGQEVRSYEVTPSLLPKFSKIDGAELVGLPTSHGGLLPARARLAALQLTPRAGEPGEPLKAHAVEGRAPFQAGVDKQSGAQSPMGKGLTETNHLALESVYIPGCPASLADAFSAALFPRLDLNSVPSGTCLYDLGPRAVLACTGPVYSLDDIVLPDSQRQVEDVEAQLQIASRVHGAFGVYDAPDGVYPWGDSGSSTSGHNSTSVTKLPKVLFGTAVTVWNEMLVYQQPQLVLLVGTDIKAWDTAVPRLILDLVSLGNLSLGLDNAIAQYVHNACRLLRLVGSVRSAEDGTFSGEAKLPSTSLHRWDVHFTPEGHFAGVHISGWLLDLPGLCGSGHGFREDILLRFTVGVLDKEDFFLGPNFPSGCLRALLGEDTASLSLTEDERERLATDCADLLVQVLMLDESQGVCLIKIFLAVSILARENSCVSSESISAVAHLLGISASDLGAHLRTAVEGPHVEAANLGSVIARTLYRQVFQFIVARINAVLQNLFRLGNQTFDTYVRNPFSVSILDPPTELDALPTVSVGKLGCYAAQAVGFSFAFRGLRRLQKLLHLGEFSLPSYLDEIGNFTPTDAFSESFLLPDSGLLPFLVTGPKSEQDILRWLEDHTGSPRNEDLNFFSRTFKLASESHLEVALPREKVQLDVSEAASFSQPLDPLVVSVCNFIIHQSEPTRRLRLPGITRSSGLQRSEGHLLYASLQEAWNPLLESRPVVLQRGATDGWSALSHSLEAIKQWEQHGFPLFVVIAELPKYCPNLFPPDCVHNLDRLMLYLSSYINTEGVLLGNSLLALRSQEYERLQQLQEEAAEVVARRRAWLADVMELDSEIRDIVNGQEDSQHGSPSTNRFGPSSSELGASCFPLSQWAALQEAAKESMDILELDDDSVSMRGLSTPGSPRYEDRSPAMSARVEQGICRSRPGSLGSEHCERGAGKAATRAPSAALPHTSLKVLSQVRRAHQAESRAVGGRPAPASSPQSPATPFVVDRSPSTARSGPIGDPLCLLRGPTSLPAASAGHSPTPKSAVVSRVNSPQAGGVPQQVKASPRGYGEASAERGARNGVQNEALSVLVQGSRGSGAQLLPRSPASEAKRPPSALSVVRERPEPAGRPLKVPEEPAVHNVHLNESKRLAAERERLVRENERLQLENQRLQTENLRLENERLHEENAKLSRQQGRLKTRLVVGDGGATIGSAASSRQALRVAPTPGGSPALDSKSLISHASDAGENPKATACVVHLSKQPAYSPHKIVEPQDDSKAPQSGKPEDATAESTPAEESSGTPAEEPVTPTPKAPQSGLPDDATAESTPAEESSGTPAERLGPNPEAPLSEEPDGATTQSTPSRHSLASPLESAAPNQAQAPKTLPVSPKKAAMPVLSESPTAKGPPAPSTLPLAKRMTPPAKAESVVVRHSLSPPPETQQVDLEEQVDEPLSANDSFEHASSPAAGAASFPHQGGSVKAADPAADLYTLQDEVDDERETVSFEDDTDLLGKGMRAVWVQAAFSGVWKGVVYWPKHLEKLAEASEDKGATRLNRAGKKCVELTAAAFFDSFVDTAKVTAERDRQLVVSAGPVGDFPQPRGTVRITRGRIRGREAGHVRDLVPADGPERRGSASSPTGYSRVERRDRGSECQGDRLPLQLLQDELLFDCSSQVGTGADFLASNASDLEGTWNGKVVWKPPATEYGNAAKELSTIILVDLTQPDGGVHDPRGPLKVFRSDHDGAPRPIAVPQRCESIAEKLKTIFDTMDVSGVPIGAGNVYFIPPNQSGMLAITTHSHHRDTGLCIQEPDDQITTFADYGERRRKEQHDAVMRRLEETEQACTFRPKLISSGSWRAARKTVPEPSHPRPSGLRASRASSSRTRIVASRPDGAKE
uniref:Proteophosphoglycan ppg4, related n=1 Tax=Neospora caninum (strain Liverpool) TaxID=572307 RepID=A0A0F7UGV1_NEOCL|nr:TPA: Proteophosphoglycan ppg4, related [Neospora caninum Liverpool]